MFSRGNVPLGRIDQSHWHSPWCHLTNYSGEAESRCLFSTYLKLHMEVCSILSLKLFLNLLLMDAKSQYSQLENGRC